MTDLGRSLLLLGLADCSHVQIVTVARCFPESGEAVLRNLDEKNFQVNDKRLLFSSRHEDVA